MNFHIEELNAHTPASLPALVELWNLTLGAEFAISVPYLTQRLTHPPAWPAALVQAHIDNHSNNQSVNPNDNQASPAGLALLSAPPAALVSGTGSEPPQIHVDGLAVHPTYQRRGIGRGLVDWAVRWGKQHHGANLVLGDGPVRLLPGVPVATADHPAWAKLNFAPTPATRQDLLCAVASYVPPATVVEIPGVVRPLAPGERGYLHNFLETAAPAAQLSLRHFLAQGGRIADIMGLWTADGLVGAARLVVEDSVGGIEPWFPYDQPKPWAALQLITPRQSAPAPLAPTFHAALLDAALRRLHNMGVNTCILDDITESGMTDPQPFADFGFTPYHVYQPFTQPL
ncbi:MAG: GNAT family N-acetyltransferase [Litorilinea sp.]